MRPALLAYRSMINHKQCSLPQLTASPALGLHAKKQDKQEISIALGRQQHEKKKMYLGWKFRPHNH